MIGLSFDFTGFEAIQPFRAWCYWKVNRFVSLHGFISQMESYLHQSLYQCEAQTLPFRVWFQNILQHFVRSSANWKVEIQKFHLRKHEESGRNMSNLFVSLHQEILIMIAEFFLRFISTVDWHSGHSVGHGCPPHRPRKWWSRHTKLSSIFT